MPLTAEEFINYRFQLAEEQRWSELIAGEVVPHAAPDAIHGTTVLNLSKRLAESQAGSPPGAAVCFDLGVITQRTPDSVLVPAVSVIPETKPFELIDQSVTDKRPAMVVEILSTQDRCNLIEDKIAAYLQFGVSTIWLIDPATHEVRILTEQGVTRRLSINDELTFTEVLPAFRISIQELFAEPSWWTQS